MERGALTYRMSFRKSFRTMLGALIVGGVLASVACSSPTIDRKTRRAYPRIRPPEQIECFDGPVPDRPHTVLAVIDSNSVTTSPVEARKRQLDQLRKAASRVGAEAVYETRQLTRQWWGFVSNPNTPFPSLTQGWTDEYFLRGTAVAFNKDLPAGMRRYAPPQKPVPAESYAAQILRSGAPPKPESKTYPRP